MTASKSFSAAAVFAAATLGAEVSASAAMFKDGDRVVFFGDSITAGGNYHRYLSDYYITRFPDADIRFFNAGVGGDNSHNAAMRFADDVATRRPTAISVMFGMNDFGFRCYNDTETEKNLREESAKRGATLVDFYTVLNDAFRERRRLNPSEIFASDRVHVCAGVHLLMAMAFLVAQKADRVVSDIALREGRSIKSIKADVSDIVTNENGSISFTVLEKSLPMPFADDASSCTNAPIVAEYNQQILAFYMLNDGDWMLTIDGEEICAASAAEWERGVNLAFNKKTPQHRQAMKVLEANRARSARANEIEAARRRIRHEMLHKMPQQKLDPAKAEDREVYLAKSLEKMWWKPAKIQMTAAVREWNDLELMLDECDEAWPKVRALAKPVPHKYVLRRIENVK